jgi:hypothetical protein
MVLNKVDSWKCFDVFASGFIFFVLHVFQCFEDEAFTKENVSENGKRGASIYMIINRFIVELMALLT